MGNTSVGKFFQSQYAKQIKDSLLANQSRPEIGALLDSKIIRESCSGQCTISLFQIGDRLEPCVLFECKDSRAAKGCLDELSDIFGALLNFKQLDEHVVFSQSLPALNKINKTIKVSLANSKRFKQTVVRTNAEVPDPSFWLYLDPFRLAKFQDANRTPSKGLNTFELASDEGFEAVQAIGIAGIVTTGGTPTQLYGYVFVEKPFVRSMRMLDLINQPVLTRNEQIFATATSRGSLSIQWAHLLRNFSTVFDAIAGEGEEGVFELVLNDLKNSPDGPKLDLQTEFVDLLDGPIQFGSIPVDNAIHTAIAIGCKDSKRMTNTISRFYADDPQAKRIENHPFTVWGITPVGDTRESRKYFIAVENDHFWYSKNLEAIGRASNTSGKAWPPWVPRDSCLSYELDFESISGIRFDQLRNGNIAGIAGALLKALNITTNNGNEPSAWPSKTDITKFFRSTLKITGQSITDGFKLSGEIK